MTRSRAQSRPPARRPDTPRSGKRPERKQARVTAARRLAAWRRAGLAGLAVAAALAGVVALVVASREDWGRRPGLATGIRIFENLERNHVPGSVSYPQTPPVGGNHNPVWQNCGFYDEPIPTERGVHSLEHGAVWVTHSFDLPADQVDALRRWAAGEPYLLVSPWAESLPSPVVASSWGRQLELPSASDDRLSQFIRAFVKGPNTPEPGAPCSGGQGTPQ